MKKIIYFSVLLSILALSVTGLGFSQIMAIVDTDGDGIDDSVDNCITISNPTQFDLDNDGLGNACDPDVDDDGINNPIDNCTFIPNSSQTDTDGDGIGDVCDTFTDIQNYPFKTIKKSPVNFRTLILSDTSVTEGDTLGNVHSQNCMSGSCSNLTSMNFGTDGNTAQVIRIISSFDYDVTGIQGSKIKELNFNLSGCWHGGEDSSCNDQSNPGFTTSGNVVFVIWNGNGWEPIGSVLSLGTSSASSSDLYSTNIVNKTSNFSDSYVHNNRITIAIQTVGSVNDLKVQQVIDSAILDVKYYEDPIDTRPNFIVIDADDQAYGTTFIMPNVIQLADEGLNFTNAFVNNPLCCPARASFLTGQHSHTHGIWTNHAPSGGATVFNDSSTLAVWLNDTGYTTSMVGKYLNDYLPIKEHVPPGFDDWHAVVPPRTYGYKTNDNGIITQHGVAEEDYSTDVIRDKSLDFIQTAERPFFLWITPTTPHIDPTNYATAAPRHIGTCGNIDTSFRPPSYNEGDVTDKPLWVQNLKPMDEIPALNGLPISGTEYVDQMRKSMLCSLKAIDEMVGNIVDELGPEAENTVIIFTSDNGYAFGEHRWYYKTCEFEECIKVPLIIKYPALIPPGVQTDQLVQRIDLTETIIELANAIPTLETDGTSLTPLFSNPNFSLHDAILIEQRTVSNIVVDFDGIRTPLYKYVFYPSSNEEAFYDLSIDPYELENKIDDPTYTSIINQLITRLNELKLQ